MGLRTALVDGQQSFPMQGDGGLLWMLGAAIAYLLIGIFVFRLGEAKARRLGALARY